MSAIVLNKQLRSAIAEKRLIELSYQDVRRVAEPHDYGILNGTGKLLIYQRRRLEGNRWVSSIGWRLLELSKIQACTLLDETFPGGRGHADQRHHDWDVVFARVS